MGRPRPKGNSSLSGAALLGLKGQRPFTPEPSAFRWHNIAVSRAGKKPGQSRPGFCALFAPATPPNRAASRCPVPSRPGTFCGALPSRLLGWGSSMLPTPLPPSRAHTKEESVPSQAREGDFIFFLIGFSRGLSPPCTPMVDSFHQWGSQRGRFLTCRLGRWSPVATVQRRPKRELGPVAGHVPPARSDPL